MPQRLPPAWHSDMQLPGKLLLSAAALLLLSLALRFYRNRSPPAGKIPPGEQRENRDGDGGLRRRRRRDGGDKSGNGLGMRNAALRGQQGFPGSEEEEEEGEEVIPRKAPLGPAGTERELGRELGWELGTKSESEAGAELGSDPGSGTGSELGKELGKALGSEQGSQPGRRLGIKPGNNPGRKSRSKVVTKPGNESGSEPGVELGIKSGIKAGMELRSDSGSEAREKLGNKAGVELGRELGILLGSELGSKAGVEAGSELGILLGSQPGILPGSQPGILPGSQPGILPGSEPGILPGSEPGILPGSELGSKAGVEAGSELGILLGSQPGILPGSQPGILPGSQPGILPGSEPGSHAPGAVARSSPAGRDTPVPSSGRSPGDGCAQSPEQGPAGGAGSGRESSAGSARSLSVTSRLGLLLAASEPGSDTSHSFSSVAEIQVQESLIPERRRDGASPPGPGLRGKVYEYFVQSSSESVSRRTSLPFVPAGTSRGRAEPQSSGTQGDNPGLEIPVPSSCSAPPEDTESPPEPPSPGWKSSALEMPETPRPSLPGEVPAACPELSPVHLGNCCEVLRSAEARRLRALQDAALQVMSDHLLQVLRSPGLYGRLHAGERELLLRRRSRGRPRLVVADVPPAEPGHGRGRLCCYDEDGDRWWQLCQLPAEVSGRGCAVCSMFNYLFVLPGWEGAGPARSPSRRVLCYDPLGDSWRDICPLRQARPRCQLVALDGHLYAIGGECLATVERYDPRRDRWAFVAALPRDAFAVAHAATACDGDIFVTGGTLRSLLLRYDPRGDRWAASPAVGDKGGTAALASAHGFLYRFQLRRGPAGGDVTVSRCRASAGLWYRCGRRALPDPAGLRCAALGGLVHCLGRGFHLRFLADPVSPRFGARELRPFPEPHGSLLPAVLVLPEADTETPPP